MASNVESYFSELKFRLNIIKKQSYETELFLSSRFNVFDYIYVDENQLSDLIADLLNPNGKHGQRDIFLNEFVKLIKKTEFLQEVFPVVYREVGTTLMSKTQRRMDILIEWSEHGIMIENKPWADDQDDQIWDYKKNLERRFNENYIIVYLSKHYQEPALNSINKEDLERLKHNDQFIIISFENDLKMWISNCIKECCSEKIRWFLRDFYDYLVNKFN